MSFVTNSSRRKKFFLKKCPNKRDLGICGYKLSFSAKSPGVNGSMLLIVTFDTEYTVLM